MSSFAPPHAPHSDELSEHVSRQLARATLSPRDEAPATTADTFGTHHAVFRGESSLRVVPRVDFAGLHATQPLGKDELHADTYHAVKHDAFHTPSLERPHESVPFAVPSAEAPPTVPGTHLERAYHVFSNATPTTVLRRVGEICAQLDVHTVHFPSRFKTRCTFVARTSLTETSFIVRLFTAAAPTEASSSPSGMRAATGSLIVEWQRRSGDAYAFAQLFRHMVRVLAADGIVVGGATELATATAAADALLPDEHRAFGGAPLNPNTASALPSLSSICYSPFVSLANCGEVPDAPVAATATANANTAAAGATADTPPDIVDYASEDDTCSAVARLVQMLLTPGERDINAEAAYSLARMPGAALTEPTTLGALLQCVVADSASASSSGDKHALTHETSEVQRCALVALSSAVEADHAVASVVFNAGSGGASVLESALTSRSLFTRRAAAQLLDRLLAVAHGGMHLSSRVHHALVGESGLSSSSDVLTRDVVASCLRKLT